MTRLIQHLLEMLKILEPAPGTSTQAIRDLLRAQAVIDIQEDPSQAEVPVGDFDPLIVEAIHAGAEQVATLKAAGIQLRVGFEALPKVPSADMAERPTEVSGPFVVQPGLLGRVVSFQSSKFLPVNLRQPFGPFAGELLLLMPADTTADTPDKRSWTLPAGTVWIRSRFLAAAGPDFAGLRIGGGTLQFDRPVVRLGGIIVPLGAVWTLSVEPEQPAPGDAAGSDADALNLRLPARLEVHSNAPPVATGDLTLSGFGSDLNLTPSGAVFVDGIQICFPLQATEPQWFIGGNRSGVTQFSGESAPDRPRWAIPTSSTPPKQLGEAAHGGSIVVSFSEGLTSTSAAQQGDPFRWFVATLTANAARIEIQSLQPDSGARYDFELWETSISELRFAKQPIERLIFRSERGGLDSLSVSGGACANKWDLPRRADGLPFAFEGGIDVFGLLSTPGSFLMTLNATAPASPGASERVGLALENLYILVWSLSQLSLIAEFDAAPLLPSGKASLIFDVNAAIPTLPDPYAANLNKLDSIDSATGALRLVLQWADSRTPALSAHLDREVRFPDAAFDLPNDQDEEAVYGAFRDQLESQTEVLRLLDLSSREHLFGVAFEAPSDSRPEIVDNRLSIQLNRIRLLMQPQVQWEPVRIEANPNVQGLFTEVVRSERNGGPTLVGANSVKLVPVLPGPLSDEIIGAIRGLNPAAALFSLPFGLRAMARLDQVKVDFPELNPPGTITILHEPAFDSFTSARQLRLIARSTFFFGLDPARIMPGLLRQLGNLRGNQSGLNSVLPNELRNALNTSFKGIPLHYADLSGYGLSTFSEWHQDLEGANFTKVEFRVLNGRTAYEVIQFRSVLYECGARTVRTVILERHNSGRVFRVDTGWVAIDPGLFTRPIAFEKGAVQSFKDIRRIRIIGAVIDLDANTAVQPVIFDADAEIEGSIGGLVPIYDRPGYIQVKSNPLPLQFVPPPGSDLLNKFQLKLLFERVHAIGSPVNCTVRIAGTLEAQISSIVSDVALDDGDGIGFAVAVVGAPKLPRAGQWSVVRLDAFTQETSAVDQRRGVPLVRNGAEPFRFREPADARLKNSTPRIVYALLMATETSRVLFRRPKVDPGQPGRLLFDSPPLLADPYSLVQSTGLFPHPNFALGSNEIPAFQITPENVWRIENGKFTIATTPLTAFMKGGGWGMNRNYDRVNFNLDIDSGIPAPFNLEAPPSVLSLDLPGLGEIFQIRTLYQNAASGIPKLANPELIFLGALEELKKTLDSLSHLVGLPFNFDVSVTSGSGASPSFTVHMSLVFRVGNGPDGRVEIGIGKFYGQFLVRGELEAALTGVERALLFVEFSGDVQQGILPPLLYAGGLFRFSIELRETGGPVIQFTLGVVISIGGDFIPGLLEVEVTVKYGYTLIPQTLEPGVLLGLEARAKLLAGLIGFSFSVEAMARLKRKDSNIVTITAQIRVAASVQVAIFFEEDVDFETQFQQDIPLAALGLIPGVGMLVLPALVPL